MFSNLARFTTATLIATLLAPGCAGTEEDVEIEEGDPEYAGGTCDPALAAGAVTRFERALLDTIAFAEGTRGVGQDGYNIFFGFGRFSDCTRHPNVINGNCNQLCSDAAGRYQFLYRTWVGLGLPDFGPRNQDIGALRLAREKRRAFIPADRALTYQEFVDAMGTCSTSTGRGLALEWASLPPGCYGQPNRTLAQLWTTYSDFVRNLPPGGGGADIYVLSGDWNGDGVKTPGFYNARTFRWQLSDYNQSTGVSYDFGWGGPGFLPVVGDWDGDGKDTPGLYNPTTYQWSLSNRNSAGGVDLQFGWGGPGFIPVVGDWNGDGKTTPGLYNPTTFQWHLSNRNSAGGVDYQFGWGGPGFIPVVGDWNGDGTTTPGLYNPTTYKWHLSNRNSAGGVDYQFGWGGAGTLPLSGDWDKNGSSTPGLFEPRSHQWTLSNVNAAGGWAAKFGWGGAGTFTVVGGPVYTAP